MSTSIKSGDFADMQTLALQASGCDQDTVRQRPWLFSDNGPCYLAGEFADWLMCQGMMHIQGALHPPQTQGKIKRWHQTMKSRILLEHY